MFLAAFVFIEKFKLRMPHPHICHAVSQVSGGCFEKSKLFLSTTYLMLIYAK